MYLSMALFFPFWFRIRTGYS